MEQTVGEANIINYVNQYHNGWGTYGMPHGVTSTFHTKLKVTAGEEAVQNNWYTLALQWTADQVTYYYNNIWAHYYKSDSENKIATFTKNSNLSSAGFTLEGGNTGDTYNASLRATQCTDWGYDGHLKAVPTCPVNVFLSTEIGPGWGDGSGSSSLPGKLETLPVWVEADYIAYYVPDVPVQSVKIPEDLKLQYATVYPNTPDFRLTAEVLPANATSTEVKWSSSDEDVLTVSSDGTVSILKAGTATVTVASVLDPSKSDSLEITVASDATPVESVTIDGDETVKLDYMGTTTLTVTISPDDASVKNVEWTVAPEGIVELENADTETVTVNAVGSGTATITVTSVDNPEATDSVSVTIAPPTAPATFEAHGTTFNKVDSLEFSGDDGALPDYATVEEVDGGEGRITFSGDQMVVNAGTKTKLVYTPQTGKEFDFVLIHASYSGGTPNAYINNFNSNSAELPHLQYIRDTNKLQVFSADWTRSADTNFTFSGDPALYGIYAASGTYAFAIQKNCYESQELFEKLGSYDAVDFGSDKVEFVFEGSGTARIDYIGFYKAQDSLVDTSRTAGQSPAQNITRGGKNYTLVSSLFAQNNNASSEITGSDLSFVADGSVLKITQNDTANHTVNLSVPDNTGNAKQITFIEVRAKIDGNCANSQAQLGLTWSGTFFRYSGGWKSGAWNAGNNSTSAISPTVGAYSLYGVALADTITGTWTFFFDSQQTGAGTLKDLSEGGDNAVKGLTAYPFFYKFNSEGSATFEIDYIAFYTDAQ